MTAEVHGEDWRRGRYAAFIVLALLLAAAVGALPPAEAQASGGPYELNIEVDYYEGLLWPEVIEAFDFLVTYFEDRGIKTEVDFNSTNNVIEGNGYHLDMRAINRQYHDKPETHIYFVLARHIGHPGFATHQGAVISLDLTDRNYHNIRFLVMQMVGYSIGVGLHDDTDWVVQSWGGFMARYSPATAAGVEEYLDADWESAFAPDGTYGEPSTYYSFPLNSARIWNRLSVMGEIYDDTGDVTGTATGEGVGGGLSIHLKDVHGLLENQTYHISHGTFSWVAKPGNYTLEMQEGYWLSEPLFVNVTEREVIHLGNVAIERAEVVRPPPVESPSDYRMFHVLAAAVLAGILLLAFALWTRKRDADRPRGNRKIMAAAVLTAVLLLIPSYIYLGPNDIYDAVNVNELYDDMVDRNGDGVIDESDLPMAWHSYKVGDRVVVRDRIESIWFQPDENRTYIMLTEYSGKYSNYAGKMISTTVPGDITDAYAKGDIITLESRMRDMQSYGYYIDFTPWKIVE